MMVPATSRQTRTFEDRADALAHFFLRAGEAPRLLAYDDAVGCPLDQGLAAIEWTGAVGILAQDDLIHAARLGADAAAAVVERKDADQRVFIYFGPRMDAPPADPYEGTLLYDEPGVRAYIFAQRRAGRLLAGLCGSSRGFLKRGRPQMSPTVYEDSVQLKARRLVMPVDSLIKYTTTCEDSAAATPNPTMVGLGKRMKGYDAALRDFRVAIGLPVKEDTSKTSKRP